MLTGLALGPVLGGSAGAQGSSGHAALHASLASAGAFDDYAGDSLTELAAALGPLLGLDGGVALNRPTPGPRGVMIAVLRAARDRPAPLPMAAPPVEGLGSPRADPERRVVWIPADFLRLLAVRIALFSPTSYGGAGRRGPVVVAETLLSPPPAWSELWRPETGPALRRGPMGLVWRGALGFVLAHELAHVRLGPAPPSMGAAPELPRRARQLAPMCPALTAPAVASLRDYERRADALALDALLRGGPVFGQPAGWLPGELGVRVLLALLMADDLVRVGMMVDSPAAQQELVRRIGPALLEQLRERVAPLSRPEADLPALFFTDTHPAAAERLLAVATDLARRPGSRFESDPDPARDERLMLELVGRACGEALRHGGR